MAYPSSHLYLTVHWIDTREPEEAGQFGIRFDSPATDVTQAMVDACSAPVKTFWQHAGTKMPAPYSLDKLRLALIGENGQYVPGTFSRDHVYSTKWNTPTNTANPMPLQVASAATLLTSVPRGQASHGRCFLPPLSGALQGTGRWSTADVDARAQTFADMLTALGPLLKMTESSLPSFAAVFSKGTVKSPNGAREFVRGVKIGTRPDVQRRRAKGMAELYGATKAVTGPLP